MLTEQPHNQEIFNRIASKYDFMNKIISLGMEPFWKRRAVKCLENIGAGSIILDLCGGTGDLTSLALKRFKTGSYIIYDLNPAMLNAGKNKIAPALRGHVTYTLGDAARLPYANNSIDVVMVCFGLRNLANMQACLNEAQRVLKPCGQFVCLEFAIPGNLFLKLGYRFYMATFVRLLATLITGSHATYRYLSRSIERFATPKAVCRAIANAGLTNKRQIKLFCGVGYIYRAIKT